MRPGLQKVCRGPAHKTISYLRPRHGPSPRAPGPGLFSITLEFPACCITWLVKQIIEVIFPSTQAFADVEPDRPAEVADVGPIPKKRFRTEDQKSLRNVEKYPLLPPCADSCRKKCADKLTELHRQLINATHWGKAFVARRGFLDTHITIAPKGRSKCDVQGQSDSSGWMEEQSNDSNRKRIELAVEETRKQLVVEKKQRLDRIT